MDLVAHCGAVNRGSYVLSLVLTDIASAWTEAAPIVVREGSLVVETLEPIPCAVRQGTALHDRCFSGITPAVFNEPNTASGPSGRRKHYLRGPEGLDGPRERGRSAGETEFEALPTDAIVLDQRIDHPCHLGGDGGASCRAASGPVCPRSES